MRKSRIWSSWGGFLGDVERPFCVFLAVVFGVWRCDFLIPLGLPVAGDVLFVFKKTWRQSRSVAALQVAEQFELTEEELEMLQEANEAKEVELGEQNEQNVVRGVLWDAGDIRVGQPCKLLCLFLLKG